MQTIDLIIIFGYLIGITVFGIWYAGKQETTEDYFVGSRSVPWWAIAMSIVATETSTITFVSVPGVAFAKGGNFQFLQLVFGYMLGRVVISLIFIPLYFKGELQTVYQLLGERFGTRVKMLASGLFIVMRNIADGIRLLLTAIVLAAVYTSFNPGVDSDPDHHRVDRSARAGDDRVHLLRRDGSGHLGRGRAACHLHRRGDRRSGRADPEHRRRIFNGAFESDSQFDKFDVFDFNLDFAKTYTFWGGLLGGCFLTMSTHGTDQYLVQRYLCTSKPTSASTALLTSGAVVLAQFIGFLFIGALLFAFYAPFNAPEYGQAGIAGSGVPGTFPFAKPDQVFPNFITEHMPAGLSGLVVAAIFAAALSSSLNSIAATAINDLYKPLAKTVSDSQLLKLSGILTVVIGIIQIVVAIAFMATGESALEFALSVASLFNGPVLGVFLVGTFLKRAKEIHALTGMLASMALMIYILLAFNGYVPGPRIAWPWYALIGSLTTFAVAFAATLFIRNNNDEVIP